LLNQIGQERKSVPIEELSPKEAAICNLIRKNISNKEIARLLEISVLDRRNPP